MARGRRLLGQVVLVVAVMAAGFVGAKLGMLGTREVAASHNFSDAMTQLRTGLRYFWSLLPRASIPVAPRVSVGCQFSTQYVIRAASPLPPCGVENAGEIWRYDPLRRRTGSYGLPEMALGCRPVAASASGGS